MTESGQERSVFATSLPDLGDQVAEAYRESMGFGIADADRFNDFAALLDTVEAEARRLALDHAGKVILTDLVQGVKRGLETLRRECHA